MNDLIYPTECYRTIGACFGIYNEKGCRFHEPVYHDCIELEFGLQQIPFLHEPQLQLTCEGQPIKHSYELGLLVNFGHYPGLGWKRVVPLGNDSCLFA